METFGEQIVLQPVREKERLVKENGFWVMYTGEPITAEQTNVILDQQRLDRETTLLGMAE